MSVSVVKYKNKITGYQAKPQQNGKILKGFGKTFTVKNFGSAALAKQAAVEYELEISKKNRGIITNSENETIKKIQALTLASALDEYYRNVGKNTKSSTSQKNRIEALKKHKISSLTLAAISSADINKLQNELLKTKVNSTVISDIAPIASTYKYIIKKYGIENLVSPTKFANTIPQGGNERMRRLGWREFRRLFVACKKQKNRCGGELLFAVKLATQIALRQERLMNLKWSQIDLNKKIIFFSAAEKSLAASNKRLPDFIPLSHKAMKILTELHKKNSGEYIFSISQNAMRKSFRIAKIEAGLHYSEDNFHFHDLRHEAVSLLFEAGFTDTEVMSFTGIKSYSTLMRYKQSKPEIVLEKLELARKNRVERKNKTLNKKNNSQNQSSKKSELFAVCSIYNCVISEDKNTIKITAPDNKTFIKTSGKSVEIKIENWMREQQYLSLISVVNAGFC